MASDTRTSEEPRLSDLVTGILHDVQALLQQQTALIRSEIRSDYRKTKEAALSVAWGVGAMIVGGLLLVLMLVHLLAWAVPALPLWSCYGIVGGVICVVGGVLFSLGHDRFKNLNPLPDQSVAAMKENVQWIVNRK